MNGRYPPPPQGGYGPPNHHPHQGFVPPPGPGFPMPVPPKKRRRGLKITLAIVLVGVLGFVGTAVVRGWMSPPARGGVSGDIGSGSVTDPIRYAVNIPAREPRKYPEDLPGVAPGTELSEQQLGGVDPRTLLWVTLKRQARQPVTDSVNRWYQSIDEYEKSYPAAHSVIRSAIDWRTREFTRDDAKINADDTLDTYLIFRCVGSSSGPAREGTYHQASSGDREATWKVVENPPASNCPDRMKPGKLVANNRVTDGLAPYGLSPQETDKFLSYLDQVPDLIQVTRPEAVSGKDGKKYVRLDVTLVPQPDGMNDRKGTAFLNAAFAQTGKSPFDHPYSINIGVYQGFKKRYFLDPVTLLPAYAVSLSTPRLDLGGAPVTTGPQPEIAYSLDQYSWPETIDPDAKRTEGGPPGLPHHAWPFDRITLH